MLSLRMAISILTAQPAGVVPMISHTGWHRMQHEHRRAASLGLPLVARPASAAVATRDLMAAQLEGTATPTGLLSSDNLLLLSHKSTPDSLIRRSLRRPGGPGSQTPAAPACQRRGEPCFPRLQACNGAGPNQMVLGVRQFALCMSLKQAARRPANATTGYQPFDQTRTMRGRDERNKQIQ
jgi:hypothetical protein